MVRIVQRFLYLDKRLIEKLFPKMMKDIDFILDMDGAWRAAPSDLTTYISIRNHIGLRIRSTV